MNIFRHTWQGKNTGWKYIHDIIPAGNTDIDPDEVEIVELPVGCINYSNINIEYDEVRLGIYKSPNLEITVQIDLLPSDEIYNEFKSLLYKPTFEKLYYDVFSQNSFEFGTIHRICLTYDNGLNYKEIFEGLQLLGMKGTYPLSIGGIVEYKCEIEDIKTTILKQMKMKSLCNGYMQYAHINNSIVYKDNTIQYGYNNGTFYKFITQSAIPYLSKTAVTSDMKFAIISMLNFYNFFRNIYDGYYKDAIRRYKPLTGINTAELDYVKTVFYSQVFSNSSDLGSEKSITNQYLVAGIYKVANVSDYLNGDLNNNVAGGLFHINDTKGLPAIYPNVYDFVNDFYESNLNCITIGNNGEPEYFRALGIFESSNEITLDLLNDIELYSNLEFTINDSAYKSIVADNIEVENSDLEKYEATLELSKNEKNRNIVVNLHNSPNTQSYNIKNNGSDYTKPLFLTSLANYWQNPNPALENYLQILYNDTQTPISSGQTEYTLLHRYVDFKIDNDIYSSDLIPYTEFNVNSIIEDGKPTEAMIDLQNNYSIGKLASEILLKLLSVKELAYITIEMNYNIYNNLTYYRDTFNCKYNIDLSQLEPIINNLGTEWLVVSAETDIINETTKLKLINNTAKLL